MNNADKIRNMSDEELATLLYFFDCEEFYNKIEVSEWLQSESEE